MKSVVVMGGGTGTFTVLSGLKKHPLRLAAVVAMADDGGSTGALRDELGVLPPGDVRQCLVALSKSDRLMRDLMNYRFAEGNLKGHSFGNLLLSALEKLTGSFDVAVEKASDILRIGGRVVPATLDNVALVAEMHDGTTVKGQSAVFESDLTALKRVSLSPRARANPKAIEAIRDADAVVIGPGDFYSSLVPNLLVKGIPEAIAKSRAVKIYVCNLMTRRGQTEGFAVESFADTIEHYLGCALDYVIYNNRRAPRELITRYARAEEYPVEPTLGKLAHSRRAYVGASLINRRIPAVKPGDPMVRNLIRHNPAKLAEVIMGLVGTKARRSPVTPCAAP